MKIWSIFLIVFCLFIFSGCVTTKSSSSNSLSFNDQTNTFTHEESNFAFPYSIGRFKRANDIRFYNEAGNNFSVPYNIISSEERVAATIYIYPSLKEYAITPIPKLGQTPEWFFDSHYDEVKSAIMDSYGAIMLSESDYILNRSLSKDNGKMAMFEWDTMGGETVMSHLYLFTHEGWLVKYRFSYPSKYDQGIKSEIAQFIDLFQWP